LNKALAPELNAPLTMGIGLHFGSAIVGDMGDGRWRSLTAVGDTVNTASRLEALCKVYDCELVVSGVLLASAGVELQQARPQEVEIRGRSAPLIIHTLRSARELSLTAMRSVERRLAPPNTLAFVHATIALVKV
jgi:adenylate cyclase